MIKMLRRVEHLSVKINVNAFGRSYRYVHFKHALWHCVRVPRLHVPVQVSLAHQYFAATIAPETTRTATVFDSVRKSVEIFRHVVVL